MEEISNKKDLKGLAGPIFFLKIINRRRFLVLIMFVVEAIEGDGNGVIVQSYSFGGYSDLASFLVLTLR
jgi:hypothetical protein